MKEFIINSDNEGQRLDKYLNRIVGNGGMSFIFKMLRKKNFVLNDKKATGKEILKSGDNIKLYISDDTYNKFKSDINVESLSIKSDDTKLKGFNLEKNIIYEDKDIILINKPSNMLSQKAKDGDISLNEYVLDYLLTKNEITKDSILNYKPSCINRLDRNTTGIIIAAKTLHAATALSKGLKERSIKKYYKCIVKGIFNKNGLYSGYLIKDKNSNTVKISANKQSDNDSYIETEYKYLSSNGNVSEVLVHLITGKSHQIRAHLAYLGFPIIGDNKYGDFNLNKMLHAKTQMLHAYKIEFPDYNDEFEFSNKTFICEPDFRY